MRFIAMIAIGLIAWPVEAWALMIAVGVVKGVLDVIGADDD